MRVRGATDEQIARMTRHYRRDEGRSSRMRCPMDGDYGLHGGGTNTHDRPPAYL